jgi:mRNA interferase MazF
MVKRFLEWIGIKERLHVGDARPVFFKEGDIWWCALGENIGVEINGKGSTFSRPIFVYKKLSREGFLGIPLSTKTKKGSWYVKISFQEKEIVANLAQLRVLSTARMLEKMGTLDETDGEKIKSGFLRLYS